MEREKLWVLLKAVPLKAADTTRKFRVPKLRGANSLFASAVRCFLSEIESPGAAVPETKGHRKVDLVERNASVPLKAAETTLRLIAQKVAAWGLVLEIRNYLAVVLHPLNPWV